MGYYLDIFFEKEHNPQVEKWEKERQEREKKEKENKQRRGFIDEFGCRRYTLTLPQLQELYKQFEEFVADCTQQEYNENKAAITAVYTLIHKHLNAETMK